MFGSMKGVHLLGTAVFTGTLLVVIQPLLPEPMSADYVIGMVCGWLVGWWGRSRVG